MWLCCGVLCRLLLWMGPGTVPGWKLICHLVEFAFMPHVNGSKCGIIFRIIFVLFLKGLQPQ